MAADIAIVRQKIIIGSIYFEIVIHLTMFGVDVKVSVIAGRYAYAILYRTLRHYF